MSYLTHLSACLSVYEATLHLSILLSVSQSVSQSIYLSVYLSIMYLSTHPSLSLAFSFSLSLSVSLCLCIFMSIYTHTHTCLCMFVGMKKVQAPCDLAPARRSDPARGERATGRCLLETLLQVAPAVLALRDYHRN